MAKNISVPDIGDFKDVEIIEVLVKPGDNVKKNDPVVTLESDKSSVEVPSPFEGKIAELKVKIGDKVSEGSILATLEGGEAKKEEINEDKKIKSIKVNQEEVVQAKKTNNDRANGLRNGKQKIYAQPISKDDIDPAETQEWLDSLKAVVKNDGSSRAGYLLKKVIDEAYTQGLTLPDTRTTPYINTIPAEADVRSPGDQNIERKIRAYIRWNAAAMVVKANKKSSELGGHIGTFASAATL